MRAPERAGGWQKERPFLPGSQAACGPVEPRSGPGPAGARRRRRVRPVMPARVVRRRVAGPYVHRAMARRARRSSTRRVRANAGAPGRAPAGVARVGQQMLSGSRAQRRLVRVRRPVRRVVSRRGLLSAAAQRHGRDRARGEPSAPSRATAPRARNRPSSPRGLAGVGDGAGLGGAPRRAAAQSEKGTRRPHRARDTRRATAGGRGAPLCNGSRADPVRQDERARHPGDPGVVGAGARDEREGRPAQRDARMAKPPRRGPLLRPDRGGGPGSGTGRFGAIGLVSPRERRDLVRGKAHGLGALLGGQGR